MSGALATSNHSKTSASSSQRSIGMPVSAEKQIRKTTLTVEMPREDTRRREGSEGTFQSLFPQSVQSAHGAQQNGSPQKIEDKKLVEDKKLEIARSGAQSAKGLRGGCGIEEQSRTIGALRMSKLLHAMGGCVGWESLFGTVLHNGDWQGIEQTVEESRSAQSTQSFDAENLFFDSSDREDEASASSRSLGRASEPGDVHGGGKELIDTHG